jgi:drug/metabolite transporter (DMT)-like permease
MALAAGVTVFNELLTVWNVAARALISVGCALATRRHEENR